MAGGIVALGDEDVVVDTALQWLVDGDRRSHKLLLNLSESVETGLEFKVVVAVALGNRGNNGDVVTLGGDVVRP